MSVVNTETVVMMGAALAAAGNVQGRQPGTNLSGRNAQQYGSL